MGINNKYSTNKEFFLSFLSGTVLLLSSIILQFYANAYTVRKASESVTDIVLSNTRAYDVDGLFVYGAIILFFIVLALVINKIQYAPFIMKSVAIFTIIRAFFISLTHISPYPDHVLINSAFFSRNVFSGIFTGDGMFFSGHTGLPFLLALLFWDNIILRYIFLFFSIMFGLVVLLGHLHYSIDVMSAFFITYSIFQICKYIFPEDWKLFLNK